MPEPSLSAEFLSQPKAELHLHLEGSIEPATICELAARHGVPLTAEEPRRPYRYCDFAGFIEAFKWVTLFLRAPEDYAQVAQEIAERLRAQNVVYAEVTLSVGVMLLREQDAEANFAALCRAAEDWDKRGLRLRWIFDAARQFGPEAAMQVARLAAKHKAEGVIAYGMGGDELALPASDFRAVYDYVAEQGLRRLIHAGEIGGPQQVREAVELLGAERIGHGIGAMHDPALMDLLAERRIALEICPTSNLRTGALARQCAREDAVLRDHPLPRLLRHGIPVVLSTDDPAMFETSLLGEYRHARTIGLSEAELLHLAQMSFDYAFAAGSERKNLATGPRAAGS